jgi:tRNA(Ile2) C34 agmatinyltransferase TiaS
MARPRIRHVVLGVRREAYVHEFTYTRVRCGRCGAEWETTGTRTSTCRACGRVCRLDQAATVGGNVTPIRRRA